MLRRRSSFWILALIIGSVCGSAKDGGIIANKTEQEATTISIDELKSEKEAEATSQAGKPTGIAQNIKLEVNDTKLEALDEQSVELETTKTTTTTTTTEVLTTIATNTLANQTQTDKDRDKKQETDKETDKDKDKDTSRKGTIQFIVNAPTTRYPPHYYTTPYTHPPTRPTRPYYPYPYPYPYPPHHEHYPTTTARPYPSYPGVGYPGVDYPGTYPGYPFRPGYPGYIYGPYGPYGPYGYPWYPWWRNNTDTDRSIGNENIVSEIQQTPIKSVPFFSFFNFGYRKK